LSGQDAAFVVGAIATEAAEGVWYATVKEG
jgi:hypothetical protein